MFFEIVSRWISSQKIIPVAEHLVFIPWDGLVDFINRLFILISNEIFVSFTFESNTFCYFDPQNATENKR